MTPTSNLDQLLARISTMVARLTVVVAAGCALLGAATKKSTRLTTLPKEPSLSVTLKSKHARF